MSARAALIGDIQISYRRYWQWMRSELAVENAIHAAERSLCRVRTNAEVAKVLVARPELADQIEAITTPMREALAPLHEARCGRQKAGDLPMLIGEKARLERMARQLPVWPWAESTRGFGALGLAQIVAEAGELEHYANPAKLWKRMGLAVLDDGTRQRNIAGVTAERALAIGYVARRRAVMAVIGDSLLRGNRDGEYRAYYLTEKARQAALHPDRTPMLCHKRALRHMEKRLLLHLWREWRKADGIDPGVGWQEPAVLEVAS